MKKREKKKMSPGKVGAGIGAAALGVTAGAQGLRDKAFDDKIFAAKRSRGTADFLKKLQPGDILFHRAEDSAPLFGDTAKFIKQDHLLQAMKGSPYYHSSVYKGAGNVVHQRGQTNGVMSNRLSDLMKKNPSEVVAFRPDVTDASKKKALNYLETARGEVEYPKMAELGQHAFGHLTGLATGGETCRKLGGKQVCTQLTANAFPELFKDQFISPRDMMRESGEMVGKLGRIAEPALADKVLSYGLYPAMRNAKWGVLAGLGGYGLAKLMSRGNNDELR